jgi:copper resistance protein D
LDDPLAYVRAVHFAATIVAAGALIFEVMVAAPAFGAAIGIVDPSVERWCRCWTWLIWASLAVAALSGATWLVVLAGNIYGAPIAEVWRDGGIGTVATETRFGEMSLARLAAAALLAAALPVITRKPVRSPSRAGALVLALIILIGPAWTGHAGATPGVAGEFPLAADALHLLAAGAWLGGLVPLAMLLAVADRLKEPRRATVTAIAVQRFSLLGVISVATLLASGLANSWYQVGTINALFTTTYGQLVLIKIALFAAMMVLACINRFYLTPRLATAGNVRRLRHSTIIETGLGFAAVVVVGFLGAMAPASHTHHPPHTLIPEGAAFVHIHSNAGMADVTITPGRVGTAQAGIRLWSEEFQPLAAERLTLTLTPPGPAAKPVTWPAAKDQDGSWNVDGIALSQSGNWTVTIDAALENRGRLVLDAPIAIEPER